MLRKAPLPGILRSLLIVIKHTVHLLSLADCPIYACEKIISARVVLDDRHIMGKCGDCPMIIAAPQIEFSEQAIGSYQPLALSGASRHAVSNSFAASSYRNCATYAYPNHVCATASEGLMRVAFFNSGTAASGLESRYEANPEKRCEVNNFGLSVIARRKTAIERARS